MSNPLPTSDPDSTVYVPTFKGKHVDLVTGRTYGVRKVPQTSMFEITATGSGDLPDRLKGRFTGSPVAERAVRNHLQVQAQLAAKVLADADTPEVDVFTDDDVPYAPPVATVAVKEAVENDPTPVEKPVVSEASAEKEADISPDTVVPGGQGDDRAQIADSGTRTVHNPPEVSQEKIPAPKSKIPASKSKS